MRRKFTAGHKGAKKILVASPFLLVAAIAGFCQCILDVIHPTTGAKKKQNVFSDSIPRGVPSA
jgi:hypothetical protein